MTMLGAAVVVALGADAQWTGRSELEPTGAVRCEYAAGAEVSWRTLPAGASCPMWRASDVAGVDRRELLREKASLETDRPSAGWYAGPVTLIFAGPILALTGLVVDRLERCGLFGNTCRGFDLGRQWDVGMLMIGGGVALLTGAFFGVLIEQLRKPLDDRLEKVDALLGLR